jgi:hypothetical protein
LIQPTISLEIPVPSQGHYGFHSFPVVDWFFCLYTYEFWHSLCKIVRSSVILLLPLFLVLSQTKWIERLLRGDLSYKATFSLSQGWPLNTGLTVLYTLGWPLNTGLTVLYTLGWPLNTGLTVLYTVIYHNIFQLSISNIFNIIKNIKRNA